jgi:DNA-binding MarR family transcriptional regulator
MGARPRRDHMPLKSRIVEWFLTASDGPPAGRVSHLRLAAHCNHFLIGTRPDGVLPYQFRSCVSARILLGPLMTTGSDIAIALRAAYLALHRRSEARFAPHGVTADQFVLLATLTRGGHALTQRELARRMSSDPSTVRAMLVLLERRGLVERDTDPTDARARTVALTAKGVRAYQRLWTAGEPVRAQLLGALQPGESEQLVRLLARVAAALDPACVPVAELTSSHSQEDET